MEWLTGGAVMAGYHEVGKAAVWRAARKAMAGQQQADPWFVGCIREPGGVGSRWIGRLEATRAAAQHGTGITEMRLLANGCQIARNCPVVHVK
jgi:hypothetical protein